MDDEIKGPGHLRRAGQSRDVELRTDDFEAMDIALSLVPELRLAALAIANARRLRVTYPIAQASVIQRLIGKDGELVAGGHHIDGESVRRYLVTGDLPIADEHDLANVVWVALQRCRQHQGLRQSVEAFEAALAADPDKQRSA